MLKKKRKEGDCLNCFGFLCWDKERTEKSLKKEVEEDLKKFEEDLRRFEEVWRKREKRKKRNPVRMWNRPALRCGAKPNSGGTVINWRKKATLQAAQPSPSHFVLRTTHFHSSSGV